MTGLWGELRWAGAVALARDARLSEDEAVAKMGYLEGGCLPRLCGLGLVVRKVLRVWVSWERRGPSATLRFAQDDRL
jgi:hypothetical protein